MRGALSIVVGVLLAGFALAACGDDTPASGGRSEDEPTTGRASASVVDWRAGEYASVRLGASARRLLRTLGRPGQRAHYGPFAPLGQDSYEIAALTNHGSPDIGKRVADFETLRYPLMVFDTTGGRVTAWGTTDAKARTPEGVGVGSPQSAVKRRYPQAQCFVQNEGTENPTYPLCRIRACSGRLLAFGGDPVRSIWVAAESRGALRRCRRPTQLG